MPELPEVTTTVKGLNQVLPHLIIADVWSDYHVGTKNKSPEVIKNEKFLEYFKKEVIGKTVLSAERRAKNILIHLSGEKTILIHMKMTGHLLFGNYSFTGSKWTATDTGLLQDPFNQFIHFTLSLSNGKTLAFSDMRKFAKVTLFETNTRDSHIDLKNLGPEPLSHLTKETLTQQLSKKPRGVIKSVLMDQTVVAGVGNIYSDEILWLSGIHPERKVESLSTNEVGKIFDSMIEVLNTGIELGGDSMSDYRNIYGERGGFQNSHKAYRRTKQICQKKGCGGVITRKVIGGRSAHFCNIHQK
ncbi:MAG: DNA-formamidopyrimidine glycosylase [Candidatus Zambryskibacteria bacterium]|nr:DNA-formamidopyrimidine glycosylase [Candidatus Zambryskibacteria bacterium]